ncbi:MAG: winged helix-turn-helix transcriptional regulator [Veillonella sp.]|uniref:MarR family winged helix-turn-helix transcriptional regulator n=1 Tax=Veillonella sp. TaxID=1926307 RepID=UPI0025CCF63A|nr:MarR family winged helix-turn-helix transcriptional regulator [Veillonella sp.]MBS4913378.1 winged helix-turn-helix transcriptional regulator [Veillonella sp.]
MIDSFNHTKAYSRIRDKQFSIFENYARKHGLQSKSMLILMWIYYNPHGVTQNRIVQATYSTKQVVNATIKAFKEKGYIYFDENSPDRRSKMIRLTEMGHTFATTILEPLEKAEQMAMNKLTAEEQVLLLNLSNKYTAALEQTIGNTE